VIAHLDWHRSRHDGSIDLVPFSTASPANAIDVGRLPNCHRANQFFLHQQASFSCIGSPAFPALAGQFFLHWKLVAPSANQPAWRPHLRSKAALRQAPRRHFCDPSLAVAALGGSPDRLLKDLEWLGLLFESLVIRDLRVLAQALDGEVFHYRDDYGIEVDAIVQLRDGRWGAIEVKLGQGQVEAAAAGLLRFRQQIDSRRTGEPAFLAVVCGSGYGYRRADGIAVVPVGALGL
jgi:hypothetical protein